MDGVMVIWDAQNFITEEILRTILILRPVSKGPNLYSLRNTDTLWLDKTVPELHAGTAAFPDDKMPMHLSHRCRIPNQGIRLTVLCPFVMLAVD